MKKIPAFVTLTIITLVAAALLAGTNHITSEHIARAAQEATDASRCAALSSAESFMELSAPEGVDAVCEGQTAGQAVGYVATVTAKGYAGPIEITVGADTNGTITGVAVGGSSFAETAGLGSKAKEPAFTEQFLGKTAPITLNDGVDAISGATITSRAVVDGVNQALGAMPIGE